MSSDATEIITAATTRAILTCLILSVHCITQAKVIIKNGMTKELTTKKTPGHF